MSYRYLYNSRGKYVAFASGRYLFSPQCDWIGFIANGNEVYDLHGRIAGFVLDDDRIVTSNNLPYRLVQQVPFEPLRPLQPLEPFPRLAAAPLPYPWRDMFPHGPARAINAHSIQDSRLSTVENGKIYSHSGLFLGTASRNKFDHTSLSNAFGNYGNKFSQFSILNKFGQYGSKYSQMSPFNPYSTTPPYISDAQSRISYWLTTNRNMPSPIDPYELLTFLGVGLDPR